MEIHKQAKIEVEQLLEREKADCSPYNMSTLIVKRRQSLPAISYITQHLEKEKWQERWESLGAALFPNQFRRSLAN